MSKPTIPYETFLSKAIIAHGNKFTYPKDGYKSLHQKVAIICPIHGLFHQIGYDHIKGRGCYPCHHISQKTWTLDEDSFMIENYASIGAKRCAEILSKTESAVYSRATTLKIQKQLQLAQYKEVPRRIIAQIEKHANDKNRICSITEKDIYDKWIKQNKKCALSGLSIQFHNEPSLCTASVDRINCAIGYIPENIQILHKDINLSKRIYSDEYYVYLCKLVANNHKNRKYNTEIEWFDDMWNDTEYPEQVIVHNENLSYIEDNINET